MSMVIKVSGVPRISGEYNFTSDKTIEETLDYWEDKIRNAGTTKGVRVAVGYYTFREKDLSSGTFHSISQINF